MHSIGAFEAKTHFSALLERVEKGEQIVISRHGRPIAKLVPITKTSQESVKAAVQSIKAFNRQHTLGGLDWKSLRDAGRR